MRAVFRLGSGLIYAIISVVLVIGGLSLALAESFTAPHPTATLDLSGVLQTLVSTQLAQAGTPPTPAPVFSPTSTSSPPPPTNCPPPSGWYLISIQPGDTLAGLAARYHTNLGQLRQANCLLTDNLIPGYGIYVPASAAPANSPVPCGVPYGWLKAYQVQPGDTLFHIATLYGTSVTQLQRANCKLSTNILIGEWLWVPNSPTITPGVTIIPDFGTPTEAPTLPLTSTPLPYTETLMPTATGTPSATSTLIPASPTITAFPTTTP